MRLLFVAPLVNEHHEAAVGIDLATQVRPAGTDCHIVVAPYNEHQARRAGLPHTVVSPTDGAQARATIRTLVAELRPDAIVLCDYVGYWLIFTYTYELDPWFIDDLGVPILPIDLYELERTDRELEIMGSTARVSDRILDMPAHLRPVPVARPDTGGDGRGFPYRRVPTLRPATGAHRERTRSALGLTERDRMLLIPLLDPQHAMLTRGTPQTRELAAKVPELVVDYLLQLPDDTHVVVAGPWFDAFDRLPAERAHRRVRHSAQDLQDWIQAADAVWSFYFPAAALESAVFADVAGLLTLNSTDFTGDAAEIVRKQRWSPRVRSWLEGFREGPPAFTLWPWKWNGIMRPLLQDNPFREAVKFVELLDEAAVVESLGALLGDPGTRAEARDARDAYRDRLRALPPTVEVVRSAARTAGALG